MSGATTLQTTRRIRPASAGSLFVIGALLFLLLHESDAFHAVVSPSVVGRRTASSGGSGGYSPRFTDTTCVPAGMDHTLLLGRLQMSANDFDDDDDEDDDAIDPDSLGDWRAFRMNLAESGLTTATPSQLQEDAEAPSSPSSSSSSAKSLAGEGDEQGTENGTTRRPRSVSKRNEEVLKEQNEELAEEYSSGVWAHEAPVPEVGGLVCRLPLEAEIYRLGEDNLVGKKLRSRLNSPNDHGYSDDIGKSLSSSSSSSSKGVSFSPLAAKTVHWYRGAQTLVKQEMEKVTSQANENGQIDATQLPDESKEFLSMYVENMDAWQEVGLVTDQDAARGTATTLVLNRPMAFKLTENLARLALFGAYSTEDVSQTELLVRFLVAFEQECAIYVGGPDNMDQPATMIHGIKDLPGAVEIAPGLGIYEDGIEAAVAGILAGTYKPLDFRFFVGRHKYEGGKLDAAVRQGKYQPIACARSVALKQCIQLPKPLWHEVLELCGGELKEISSLELMKRDDIRTEDLE